MVLNARTKQFILYSLFIGLSFHFLKDDTSSYYLIIFSIYFACFLNLIIQGKIFYKSELIKTIYIFFLFNLFLSCIYTLYLYQTDRLFWEFNAIQIVVSFGRVFLMPIVPFLILALYREEKDFDKTFLIFLYIVVIGVLTMAIQQIIGGISVFGTWGPPRFAGMIPYSGSIGNITIFGSVCAIPLIIVLFNNKFSFYFKAFIIITVAIGCFLTMQKSALINFSLAIILILTLVGWKKRLQIIFILIISALAINSYFPKISYNAKSLFSNTFGYELIEGTTHKGIYRPIEDRFLERLIGETYSSREIGAKEFWLGYGTFGGTNALGFNFWSNELSEKNVIGTSHNQFLDLFQQGGILLLINFIFLIIFIQLNLARKWLFRRDNYAKIFFFCNCFFILNCIVANGIIYHPIASLIFWISITYSLFISQTNINNEVTNSK